MSGSFRKIFRTAHCRKRFFKRICTKDFHSVYFTRFFRVCGRYYTAEYSSCRRCCCRRVNSAYCAYFPGKFKFSHNKNRRRISFSCVCTVSLVCFVCGKHAECNRKVKTCAFFFQVSRGKAYKYAFNRKIKPGIPYCCLHPLP